MILQFAKNGSLRDVLSVNFNNILWSEKISYLFWIIAYLNDLH
jgi:hypothetical protein